jgi:hypothetical protein
MKPGYITMTQRQSNNQWNGGITAHPTPKNSPSAKIRWKSSCLDFFGSRCHSHYLPKGQSINVEYYSSLLVQFDILGFQCLDHPPYPPDMAPSDYHLFPRLKKQLTGRHFLFDTEVIAATETWLDGQPLNFFV